MPVLSQCPACTKPLRLPDNALGKQVRCPSCQTVFVAQAGSPAAAAPPPPAAAPAPRPAQPPPLPVSPPEAPRPAEAIAERPRLAAAAAVPPSLAAEDEDDFEERAPRRRRRPPERPRRSVWPLVALGGGALVVVALAAVGVAFLVAGGTEDVSKWQEFSPPGGGFRVRMPGEPTKQTQQLRVPGAVLTVHLWMYENKRQNSGFAASYTDFPPVPRAGGDDAVLVGAQKGAVANVPGGRLTSEKRITLDGHPGREFTIDIPGNGTMYQRVYLVGNRLYQVVVARGGRRPTEGTIQKYFESFQLTGGNGPPAAREGPPPPQKGPPVGPPTTPKGPDVRTAKEAPPPKMPGELLALPQPHGNIQGLAFAPDGKTLASVGSDETLRLWDLTTGKQRTQLMTGGPKVQLVAYSPDGLWLATRGHGDEVALRDGPSGRTVSVLQVPALWSVAFSPDNKTLAAAGDSVKFLDLATRREDLPRPLQDGSQFLSARFALGGKALVTAGLKGTTRSVRVWNWPALTPRDDLRELGTTWAKVEVSPDGRYAGSLGNAENVQLMDLQTMRALSPAGGGAARVAWFTFAADSRGVFTWGPDGWVHCWDLGLARETSRLRGTRDGSAVLAAAVTRDGWRMATASQREIIVWNLPDAALVVP